jgi:hypothetical protein
MSDPGCEIQRMHSKTRTDTPTHAKNNSHIAPGTSRLTTKRSFRSFFLRSLAALMAGTLSVASPASAGQAIYRSTGTQVIYGNGITTRVQSKGFWVVDPDTGRFTALGELKINGMKLFTVVPAQNYRLVTVRGSRGATYTVISKAESPGTQFANTLLESVYGKGLDSSVLIDSAGVRRLPRTFSTLGRALVLDPDSDEILAVESSGSAVLDIPASRASSLAESFDDTVARLALSYVARGFTQFTAPPALP